MTPEQQHASVRDALRSPHSLLVDLLVVAVVISLVGGLLAYARQVAAPFAATTTIDLSWTALPRYTFFSLCRGFAAYAVSLAFAIAYARLAARSARAARVMLPTLDVLQSIPVLGFLPGLVLGMIALFPTREIGLEFACIVMIVTAQAWNMTLSLYSGIKSVPQPLREAAAIYGLPRRRVFRALELPASMIGLVWNSMMSMAGGWFFLTVNEAFVLGDKDFRLPGIGSYMAEAINHGDTRAMLAAIAAMSVMIVAVDQLFWRPIVAWSERFKLEETADAVKPGSWFLTVLRRSHLAAGLDRIRNRLRPRIEQRRRAGGPADAIDSRAVSLARTAARSVGLAAGVAIVAWGAWSVIGLLGHVAVHDAAHGDDWASVALATGATLLRTTAAVLLGAAWALPVGIVIGLSSKWSQRLQPVIQVVASFPAPMLFPLVVLFLKAAGVPFTAGCVLLMLLGSQWYILFNVIAGAMTIPTDLKEVGAIQRTSRWRMWTRLYVPCVFPYLVTGLVTAAGGSWNASIVSEYVQVQGATYAAFGLGSLINHATAKGNFALLAASILAMAVTVVLINRTVWRSLGRFAEQRCSLMT